MKVTLVGEQNPYGDDPSFALYPAPDGCSGHRLCCLILGMFRKDYLDSFERINLCAGDWSMKEARRKAEELRAQGGRLVLLGSKVCAAFRALYVPFERTMSDTMLVLPHPSGLCRLWQQPGAIDNARRALSDFAPELAPFIGRAKKPRFREDKV